MALLNYAKTYAEVLGELGIDNLLDQEQVKEIIPGNLVKLFFTGEGDIITHGINYLPLFTQSATGKGLVPSNTSGDIKQILRGNGTWAVITAADLPIGTLGTYNDTTLLTSSQIKQLVDTSFIANEAMRFKGIISWNETTLKWNVVTVDDPSTVKEEFPAAADIGDTYRIGSDSKQVDYADQKGSTGDLMICIKAYSNLTANQGNSKDYWTIVETNITGYSANTVNGVTHQLYSNNPENRFSIYAPLTAGVEGQMLFSGLGSSDNIPKWGALRFEGLSSYTEWSGDTPTRTITLLPASTTVFGGVKIGANISVSTDGTISITQKNIIDALGGASIGGATYGIVSDAAAGLAPKIEVGQVITDQFLVLGTGDGKTPGWHSLPVTAFSDTWRDIKVAGNSIGTASLNFMPTGDVYVKIDDQVSDNGDTFDISFGLSWWNISEGAYEYAN